MFSILIGILASILPNLVLGWLCYLFRSLAPERFIKVFYLSEGLKLAGTALLVSASLLGSGIQVVSFFGGFVAAQFVFSFCFSIFARRAHL